MSSFTKLGADGSPIVLPYTVEVRMADNSTFRGNVWAEHDDLPKWMKPGGAERMRISRCLYRVLVILPNNNHFCSRLIPHDPRPGHDPRIHFPEYAEIRFKHDEYYTASNFQEYPIDVYNHFRENMSLINHIYVTKLGFPVYRSPLNRPFHINAVNFGPNQ